MRVETEYGGAVHFNKKFRREILRWSLATRAPLSIAVIIHILSFAGGISPVHSTVKLIPADL